MHILILISKLFSKKRLLIIKKRFNKSWISLAPQTGLEPVTSWLTVMRSTDWAIEDSLCRHCSIFPGRHQPSIFDDKELNFRVRNGYGWFLFSINTDFYFLLLVTRTRLELVLSPWEGEVLTAWPTGLFLFGAPSGTRTQDPLIKSQLLYQLS